MVYVAGCDEIFRGIRVTDGKEVLQFPAGGYTGASTAIVGNRAYYGTFNNDVVAADLGLKKIVWRYQNPTAVLPVLLLARRERRPHGDRRPRQDRARAQRQDRQSGLDLHHPRARRLVPAIAGGRVYIGSNDGHFYVLDLATGKKLQDFEAGSAVSASPAIAEGRVVVGAGGGQLFCFGQKRSADPRARDDHGASLTAGAVRAAFPHCSV